MHDDEKGHFEADTYSYKNFLNCYKFVTMVEWLLLGYV